MLDHCCAKYTVYYVVTPDSIYADPYTVEHEQLDWYQTYNQTFAQMICEVERILDRQYKRDGKKAEIDHVEKICDRYDFE